MLSCVPSTTKGVDDTKKSFSGEAMLVREEGRHSQRSGITARSQHMGKREAVRQMHKLNARWIDLREPDDHRALTFHTREAIS